MIQLTCCARRCNGPASNGKRHKRSRNGWPNSASNNVTERATVATVRILNDEPLPGGRRLIVIDTATLGRAQIVMAPGEHPQEAITAMLLTLHDRIADQQRIVMNSTSGRAEG
jgi:hypothetical protein